MIKYDKKTINGWAFYDWANSVYNLVITTAIFPIYYESQTTTKLADGSVSYAVDAFGMHFNNAAGLYSYVLACSFFMISLLSPLLSGIADYSGSKKGFMRMFTYIGSISCMVLFFFDSEHLELGLIAAMGASLGYSGSLVFYNAYLPEIAPPEEHDRISARGYSLGYLGSVLLLIANLVFLENLDWFGLDQVENGKKWATKIVFVSVGLWWFGFAHVTFKRLPGNVYDRKPTGNRFTKGARELIGVWHNLKENKVLKRYLLSFFILTMGVQTVMLMAVLFAKQEVKQVIDGVEQKMEDGNLIISVLLIQIIAIGGAYLFAFASKKLGNVRALMLASIVWIGVCVAAFQVKYVGGFYALAAVVGLIMGGTQSLCRSTYSKLLPETEDHASYFSFYDVCEKVGIVIGLFSYGLIVDSLGGMRPAIFALATFFIIAFACLLWVLSTMRRTSK